MKLKDIKRGVLVKWTDPDGGICSCTGKISYIMRPLTTDSIISIQMKNGGEVDCFPHELSLPNKKKPLTKEQKSI